MADIFISYSRKDRDFVRQLHDALAAHRREVWVDWEDIPPTADWFEQIMAGIESGRALVFVLSPDSVASPVCGREIDHALAHHKRLIPLVCRAVDSQQAPEALRRLNWIFIREEDDFDQAVNTLLTAIDTDLEWVDAHTNLLEKATEWDRKGRDKSLLLRGRELREAEAWQVKSAEKEPKPTELMSQFILASRQGETSRQRKFLAGVSLALVVAVALAVVAYFQYREADRQYQEADRRGKIALSRQLAAQSRNFLGKERLDRALLMSLAAGQVWDTLEAKSSLLSALMHEPFPLTFLHGHTKRVRTLAFSPDGRTMASGSTDKTIILWDVATRQPLGPPLAGHAADVASVAFSPDGKTLASASDDKTILLWDLATGKAMGPALTGHSGQVISLAFSPDNKLLASGSYKTVTLWDVNTRPPQGRPLTGHTDYVKGLAFSPDGKLLASGDGKNIIFWDLATAQSSTSHPLERPGIVISMAFSPDSKTLALAHLPEGTGDNEIIFWDVEGRKIRSRFKPRDMFSFVAEFSSSLSLLAASDGLKRTVTLWDMNKKRPVAAPLTSHAHPIDAVAFSPNGETLASGSRDGDIILWDLSETQVLGKTVLPFQSVAISEGKVTMRSSSVAVSPDGKILAQINKEKKVLPQDQITKFVAGVSSEARVNVANVSMLKSLMIALGEVTEKDPAITLRDLTTRESLGPPLPGLDGAKEFSQVVFSPDSKFLATVRDNTTLLVWEVATQKLLASPPMANGPKVWLLAFSPDGKLLASGQDDNQIVLREIPSLKPLDLACIGHTDRVLSLTFSPDGRTLVSGDKKGTVIFWEVATRRSLSPPLQSHLDGTDSLAFSPDGRILVSGGDQSIILWDVATRRPLGPPLTGHNTGVVSVRFSPDGKTLASADFNGSIILWDLATRLPLGPLLKGLGPGHLFFSADGKTLISNGRFKTIQWEMDPEVWKSLACRMANRNLTRAEWQQYLGDLPYRKTCPDLPVPEE